MTYFEKREAIKRVVLWSVRYYWPKYKPVLLKEAQDETVLQFVAVSVSPGAVLCLFTDGEVV